MNAYFLLVAVFITFGLLFYVFNTYIFVDQRRRKEDLLIVRRIGINVFNQYVPENEDSWKLVESKKHECYITYVHPNGTVSYKLISFEAYSAICKMTKKFLYKNLESYDFNDHIDVNVEMKRTDLMKLIGDKK